MLAILSKPERDTWNAKEPVMYHKWSASIGLNRHESSQAEITKIILMDRK